jgi:hypothetical protein
MSSDAFAQYYCVFPIVDSNLHETSFSHTYPGL